MTGRRAFTLIELLVVIVVLALLITIIMPALNLAKLAARQVICCSRMKQWNLAVLTYTSESNEMIPAYADICNTTDSGNAKNPETYWYNRLAPYWTGQYIGKWGMSKTRKCPMGKEDRGDNAVWIGVYYGKHSPERAPFVFLNSWDGSTLTHKCDPFKISEVISPSEYLMLLDIKRDRVHEPVHWPWDTDYDSDGMNDSRLGIISSNLGPYNSARPKIHRGGCNVALFDGHAEWISYKDFWSIGGDGYPTHRYWYNNNRP